MTDKQRIRIIQWALLITVLGLWEVGVKVDFLNPFWVSSPRLLADAFFTSLKNNIITFHLAVTLSEALSGLFVGSVTGILLGLLLGMSRFGGQVLEPFIIALNNLPRVALAPLIVMFVGIGFSSKFLLALSLVIVPMMINTWEGIKSVDPLQINLMKVMRANRWQLFRKVLLPNSIPWLFSGLRVSLSFSIIGAIVGEFISSRAGIGYMMDEAAGGFDTTGMLMPLLVLMLVSFAFDRAILALSEHFLSWRSSAR